MFYEYDVYTLIAKYDNDTYIEQEQIAEDRYIFEQDIIEDKCGNLQHEFTIDEFKFNVISFKHYDLSYPKEMVFVGTSDTNCEIAYIYFCDRDLDFISQPLSEFLVQTCKWKRK